jgi:H+/Cl- antiporter ClcA
MNDAVAAPAAPDPASVIRNKRFLVLLVLSAIVGLVVSLAAWCFLELVYQMQQGVFTDLPKQLGFDSTPRWWYLAPLAIAGLAAAFAIVRLPGNGGHVPANGLSAGMAQPIELPGVLLAAIASLGLGLVLGPEAPLIAMGGGLGLLSIRLLRKDAPPQVGAVLGAAGAFAAVSFLFGSPVIAAVILIEAAGLGGPRLPLILMPGLLAAGIGSLVSTGMGSWTGLSTSQISLSPLSLPDFARPDVGDFLWTIPFAIAVALLVFPIFRLAKKTQLLAVRRPFLVLPVVGLAVAGLGIAFSVITGKAVSEVLFSGEDALPGLVANPGAWSLSALALLIAFKGVAYAISLGSFRGGPVFPALFIGAAAGMMAGQLPGFELTPAVAVGLGAAVVSVLRLPLSAVLLAILLTVNTGAGTTPLIVVGVVAAYIATIFINPPEKPEPPAADGAAGQASRPAEAPG